MAPSNQPVELREVFDITQLAVRNVAQRLELSDRVATQAQDDLHTLEDKVKESSGDIIGKAQEHSSTINELNKRLQDLEAENRRLKAESFLAAESAFHKVGNKEEEARDLKEQTARAKELMDQAQADKSAAQSEASRAMSALKEEEKKLQQERLQF